MRTLELSDGDESLVITSDDSDEPRYWRVTLKSGGLTATTDIDLDSLRHSEGPIGDFFLGLAADWRGWPGERTWGGGPLTLSATHDGLGHITTDVRLVTNVYYEPDWEARATILLEAGRLDQIARDAAQLRLLSAAWWATRPPYPS